MKACNQIQELLSLFLEGETSPEETRHITEHLSSCQECKKALEELKKTVELVKNLDEVEPPPFFTQKIMAHVREEAALSRVTGHGSRVTAIISRLFFPLHIKIPVQAFALVLVVGLVFLVYRSIEPEIKLSSTPTETATPALKDEVGQERKKAIPAIQAAPKEAPLKGQVDVSEPARKEEAAVPTAPPREKVMEKKSEVLAEKPSPEPSIAFAPAPKESAQLQKAPAAPPPARGAGEATQAIDVGQARQATEGEPRGVASGAAKDRMERAAAPPARDYRAAAKGFERVEFVIGASDVGSTAKEVESLLSRLGAREIEREPREPGVAVKGVVDNKRLVELVEKLKSLGELRPVPAPTDRAQGESRVLIRIEP